MKIVLAKTKKSRKVSFRGRILKNVLNFNPTVIAFANKAATTNLDT